MKEQVGGDHYAKMVIQPRQFIAANGIDYNSGTAIVYLSRHPKKNRHEDVMKAIHHCLFELEDVYGMSPPTEEIMGLLGKIKK